MGKGWPLPDQSACGAAGLGSGIGSSEGSVFWQAVRLAVLSIPAASRDAVQLGMCVEVGRAPIQRTQLEAIHREQLIAGLGACVGSWGHMAWSRRVWVCLALVHLCGCCGGFLPVGGAARVVQGGARHGIVKGAGIQVCGCLPHQVSRQVLLRFRRCAALQRGSYVKQGFGF